MHQKLLKSAHYIELGSYQYWPVLVPRGIRLYTYEQIPVSLKDNPYITDGYRAYLPSRLCIKRYGPAAWPGASAWSPAALRFARACVPSPPSVLFVSPPVSLPRCLVSGIIMIVTVFIIANCPLGFDVYIVLLHPLFLLCPMGYTLESTR